MQRFRGLEVDEDEICSKLLLQCSSKRRDKLLEAKENENQNDDDELYNEQ